MYSDFYLLLVPETDEHFQVFAKPVRGGNFCIPCSLSLSTSNRQKYKNNNIQNFSVSSVAVTSHKAIHNGNDEYALCTFCHSPQNKHVTNSCPAIPNVKTAGFAGVSPNRERQNLSSVPFYLATKPRLCSEYSYNLTPPDP